MRRKVLSGLSRAVARTVEHSGRNYFVREGGEMLPRFWQCFGAAVCRIDNRGVLVLVFVCPHCEGKAQFLQIIQARDPLGPGFGLRKCRQEQARKDCNDRNHHQQFNQGECDSPAAFIFHNQVLNTHAVWTRLLSPSSILSHLDLAVDLCQNCFTS